MLNDNFRIVRVILSFFIIFLIVLMLQDIISFIMVYTHELGHYIFGVISEEKDGSFRILYDDANVTFTSIYDIWFPWKIHGITSFGGSVGGFFRVFGGILLTSVILIVLYLIKKYRLIEKILLKRQFVTTITSEVFEFFLLWFSYGVFTQTFFYPNIYANNNIADSWQSLKRISLMETPLQPILIILCCLLIFALFGFSLYNILELINSRLEYFNIKIPELKNIRISQKCIIAIIILIVYIISWILPLFNILAFKITVAYILLSIIIYLDLLNDKLISKLVIPSIMHPMKKSK